jgi:Fe-S cluster biogenesis protein NfuA
MKQRRSGMKRSMPELLELDIQSVLDAEVRPLLHAHNGDIELTGIDEGRIVRLRLLGACATCMGAEQTVSDVIVARIREACPWVGDVRVETGVSDELVAEALRFLKRDRR